MFSDTSATHFAVIIIVVLIVIFLVGAAMVLGILYYIRKKYVVHVELLF